jgi:nitroreductase
MEKPAEPQHPIHELLRRRWSPRAFSSRPIEPEKLRSLLEAARWAASCFNEQPWSFLVATNDNPTEYAQMLHCLVEGNQQWACQAPVLMISVSKQRFDFNGKPNRTAQHDVGLAVENLVIQATALDLWVHQMAGIHLDKIRTTYGIPEGFDPVAGIAIGYAGDPETLPEKYREQERKPRVRKTLPEFVFGGRWGEPAALVRG